MDGNVREGARSICDRGIPTTRHACVTLRHDAMHSRNGVNTAVTGEALSRTFGRRSAHGMGSLVLCIPPGGPRTAGPFAQRKLRCCSAHGAAQCM